MRGVLHDFSDAQCQDILRHICFAMDVDSTVLIDETILPDRSVHWLATGLDLLMMASHGSQERTRGHWVNLIESAGLRLENVFYHGLDAYQALIVAVKMD
jgi:demethylsterigmatocystin 6-O-methyltransferase